MILDTIDTLIEEGDRKGISRAYLIPGSEIVVWYYPDICLMFLNFNYVSKENLKHLRDAGKTIIKEEIENKYDYSWFGIPTYNPRWIRKLARDYPDYDLIDSHEDLGLDNHTLLIAKRKSE